MSRIFVMLIIGLILAGALFPRAAAKDIEREYRLNAASKQDRRAYTLMFRKAHRLNRVRINHASDL